MSEQTKKLGTKQYRQEKADFDERTFEIFCSKNGIELICLDKDTTGREKFLKEPSGKSPDYLCQKDGQSIFVEVKTHTLLTNEARNREMIQTIQKKKAAGMSGTTIFQLSDPILELKSPFVGYLKSASKKFKNIKEEYSFFPRILLLNVCSFRISDVRAVFSGLYPSFRQDGNFAGFSKVHPGLLDSTGKSVSALVYWNADTKRYECLANSRAQIILLEGNFKRFFEMSHDYYPTKKLEKVGNN